jgi:Pectate lyase superfamily protein
LKRIHDYRCALKLLTALALLVAAAQILGTSPANGSVLTGTTSATSSKTCSVTRYGADATGHHDSTLAIRRAISVCESTAGPNTVAFPAGTYVLNRNDGKDYDLELTGPHPVIVSGAGRDKTRIVEKVGLRLYPKLRNPCGDGSRMCTRGKGVFDIRHADGTVIRDLTVDAQTWVAGNALYSHINRARILDDRFLGALSTRRFNPDTFDIRLLGFNCKADLHNRLSGNVVRNVILDGRGTLGNADLDFSCQRNGTLSSIADTGWGVALYMDSYVTLKDLHFTPGKAQRNPTGWNVTGPSDHITIAGTRTKGGGGILHAGSTGGIVTDVSISNEVMSDLSRSMTIEDARSVTIQGSTIGPLHIRPQVVGTSGVTATSTRFVKVACNPAPGTTITHLVGLHC